MQQEYRRPWMTGLDDGTLLARWRGFEPFWLGCFYGNNKCLGGEEKYSHCYDFFSGIGDVEWWIKSEIDALTSEQQEEMYQMMVRNITVNDRITFGIMEQLADILGVATHHIYRLGNKYIIKMVDAELDGTIKDLYKAAIKEVELKMVVTKSEPDYNFICENYTDLEDFEYTNKFVISYISGHRVAKIKVRERIYNLITEHFKEDIIEVSELLEFIAKNAQ